MVRQVTEAFSATKWRELAAQSRETTLAPIDLTSEPTQLTAVIKHLATQIKSAHANGGVLLVKSAAEAIVYANRCPSLRAIVGTCLESVDQAMTAIGANVLILEYPYKSLPQIRNLLARFARGDLYRKRGDLADAMTDMNETLKLDPNYALAYFTRYAR